MPDECPPESGPPPWSTVAVGPFGHSVGFLLSQTGAATARRFKAALEEVALEPRHFALMRAIEAAENRSQQVLAERLQIPPSSMVGLLDQLEERGIVARHLDRSDRRVRIVELTEAGRELLARAMHLAMATEQQICQGFDVDQREHLISMLEIVAANLELAKGVHPDTDN
ncbi:MAG: MarR family winged helix-turn-helix transcriptional regulator [Acidimicrobiales bacterium]